MYFLVNIVTEPTNIKGILKTGDPEPSTVLPRKTDEKGDGMGDYLY